MGSIALGEVGQPERQVVLRVSGPQQGASQHVDHRLRRRVRGATEDAADRMHVLLGHAEVEQPAHHLEVLELVVVVDRLGLARKREPERAVIDVRVLVAEPGGTRRAGQGVAAALGEEALDRQQREPSGGVGGMQLLRRAAVGVQPLQQREPRRLLGLV
jgi:hypothetical protein